MLREEDLLRAFKAPGRQAPQTTGFCMTGVLKKESVSEWETKGDLVSVSKGEENKNKRWKNII